MVAHEKARRQPMLLAALVRILKPFIAARAPCDVFDPWVRWERGQFGI